MNRLRLPSGTGGSRAEEVVRILFPSSSQLRLPFHMVVSRWALLANRPPAALALDPSGWEATTFCVLWFPPSLPAQRKPTPAFIGRVWVTGSFLELWWSKGLELERNALLHTQQEIQRCRVFQGCWSQTFRKNLFYFQKNFNLKIHILIKCQLIIRPRTGDTAEEAEPLTWLHGSGSSAQTCSAWQGSPQVLALLSSHGTSRGGTRDLSCPLPFLI